MTKLQTLVEYLEDKGIKKDLLDNFILENFNNQNFITYTFLGTDYNVYDHDQINQQLDDYFFDQLDAFLCDNEYCFLDVVLAIRAKIRYIDSPYNSSDDYDLISENLNPFGDYFIEEV